MAIVDYAANYPGQLSDPVQLTLIPTPTDAVDQPFVCTALYVGVAGNVAFVGMNDVAGVPKTQAFAVGWHPIRIRQLYATGTTATNLLLGTVGKGPVSPVS